MTVKQFFGIVEIRTKIISITTFLMGTFYAWWQNERLNPLMVLLMLTAVLLVDMGTTGFNAYFDYRSGTDRAETNREKNKVLLHQGVDAVLALRVSAVLFLLAALLGLVIASLTSWYIILVGGACMAVGYAYTGGPFPISRTPLGEAAAGGFLGTVLFMLSFYVQSGRITWEAFLVSLPSAALVAAILTANNTCDIEGDRAAGRKTLSILIGRRAGEYLVCLLGAGGYLWTGIMAGYGSLPTAVIPTGLIGLAVTVPLYRRMHRLGYSLASKDPIMGTIALVYLVFGAAVLSGLGAALLTRSFS